MRRIFKKDGIVFILMGLIFMNTLPQILSAFIMYNKNDFFIIVSILKISIFSNIIIFILITIGLSKYYESNKKLKDFLKALPLVIGYSLVLLVNNIFEVYGLDNILIISILHMVLNGIILSLSLIL